MAATLRPLSLVPAVFAATYRARGATLPEERGAALLTVLLLVAVMAVVAATALERVALATRMTGNGGAIDQARAYADAGTQIARMRIGDLVASNPARITLGSAKHKTRITLRSSMDPPRIEQGTVRNRMFPNVRSP